MPIYEYRCESCDHRIEIIQKFSDPPLTECTNCKGRLTKIIAPAALQFKGSGWYITDYSDKGKPPKPKTEPEEKTEKKSSSDETTKTPKETTTSPPQKTDKTS